MKHVDFGKLGEAVTFAVHENLYVAVFWKTDLMVTYTEIHFLLYTKVTLMHYSGTPSIWD